VFDKTILANPDAAPIASGVLQGSIVSLSGSGPGGNYYVRVTLKKKGTQQGKNWNYSIQASF
jgi:hypothetical protein